MSPKHHLALRFCTEHSEDESAVFAMAKGGQKGESISEVTYGRCLPPFIMQFSTGVFGYMLNLPFNPLHILQLEVSVKITRILLFGCKKSWGCFDKTSLWGADP